MRAFRERRFGWRLRCALLLCLAALVPGSALAQPAATGSIVLVAPQRAAVGDPIRLVLRFDGGPAAAYQARLSFDPLAAHLSQVENRAGSAAAQRWQVRDLGPVELTDGVELGAYSCFRANCAGGASAATAAAGGGVLARIEIRADEPGPLQLRLSDTEAVDATGAVLASGGDQLVTIDVSGPEQGSPHAAAAAGSGRRADPARPGRATDATGDRRVDDADVTEAALSWIVAHAEGATCAAGTTPAADANGDGCIDAADVQTFAAAAGPPARAVASPTATTFVVDTTGDTDDPVPGDGFCGTPPGKPSPAPGGSCTLRAAIDEANATSGPNTINFAIPGAGVHTIQLTSSMPTISDRTGGTYIDGYTQPGATVNTDPLADNAQLMIQIRGTGPKTFDGPKITSSGNTIRGLSFFDIRRSIFMFSSGAKFNSVIGCFVGTDVTGTFRADKSFLFASGIAIETNAAQNQVGSTSIADRNVISGNSRHGIVTYFDGSDSNVVYNNIIGLSPDGLRRLPNIKHGIDINEDSAHNLIGGLDPGERNVMSGNGDLGDIVGGPSGIEISHGTGTVDNQVVGNYIGTDVNGVPQPWTYNAQFGVHIQDSVNHNVIRDNLIDNNQGGGIKIEGQGASANEITDNRIGVDVNGQPGPNGEYGVQATSEGNTIGPGNTIAYNPTGVWVKVPAGSGSTTVTQNSIYSNNGLGIDIDLVDEVNPNDVGDIDVGPNDKLNFPVITQATPTTAAGTACAGCTVEIYLADSQGPGTQTGAGDGAYGEGKSFLASTVADSNGNFSVGIVANPGDWITSDATAPNGGTSEFSENVEVAIVPQAPPAPTLTATAGPRSVKLQWISAASIGTAVTGYRIYRGTSSGGETPLTTVGEINSYLDVEVANGTTYWYKIVPFNAVGDGTESPEASAKPLGNLLFASDRFDRTVAAGFGTADIGGAWNVSTNARTKVENSQGIITATAANQDTNATIPASVPNQEVLALIHLSPVDPVGAAYTVRVMVRTQADPRNGYAARIVHNPNGSLKWFLASVENGGGTGTRILMSGDLVGAGGAAGTSWWVRLGAQGTAVHVKFWQDGLSEPHVWPFVVLDDDTWASGGASLGVFTSNNMAAPFPAIGFANFDGIVRTG